MIDWTSAVVGFCSFPVALVVIGLIFHFGVKFTDSLVQLHDFYLAWSAGRFLK